MSRNDDLEAYENSEAQDLIRLFGAAKPTRAVHAPANFRAKVLNKIEERRARQGLLTWVSDMLPPAWAPTLAVALLLSLGLNTWLGMSIWELAGPSEPRVADRSRASIDGEVQFNAQAFQAGIQSKTPLGALLAGHSILDREATAFGFTGKPTSASAFLTGTLYAETLAYLGSGNRELTVQNLTAIKQTLVQTQAPDSLVQFMTMTQSLVEQPTHSEPTLEALLALFEPLYQQYAESHAREQLLLFRAGAWLENLYLAAAAGDTAALRQSRTAQYFLTEMQQLPAPTGVIHTLKQLDQILAKSQMNDRDVRNVQKLVKRLHDTLA